MNINNCLIAQLLLLQRLANQRRFNSHSAPRPPANTSGFLLTSLIKNALDRLQTLISYAVPGLECAPSSCAHLTSLRYETGSTDGYSSGQAPAMVWNCILNLLSARFRSIDKHNSLAPSSEQYFTRVALYVRVSTLNGQSPEMQLIELREYASRRGWEVFNEYVDHGISGSKESRPELNQLMSDAQWHFDVVLCWEVDRFGRSLKHLVTHLQTAILTASPL
jgi:Resolvase, N terminal domain